MIACAATLWWPFCSVILPRLLFSALSFAQPFLLERILDNIQQEDSDESERIALVVASGLVFVARGVCLNRPEYRIRLADIECLDDESSFYACKLPLRHCYPRRLDRCYG